MVLRFRKSVHLLIGVLVFTGCIVASSRALRASEAPACDWDNGQCVDNHCEILNGFCAVFDGNCTCFIPF